MSLYLAAQELELLRALNENQVRYIVVGGHAVSFHAAPRSMKDLDIWIEPTPENAKRVARAVSGFGFNLNSEQVATLTKPNVQFPLLRYYTEFLTSCGDIAFDEAMARSTPASQAGVPCHVLGRDDLISVKRRLGRDHDLEDVARLEAQHDG